MRTVLFLAVGVIVGVIATAATGLWLFQDKIIGDTENENHR